MSSLCLLNFLHVVQIVNLKDATQPLLKLQWGSSFGQRWSSMSKDFKWHSGSSCLQNGEGEKLKQILLGFVIGHLIVANCKKIEEHFCSSKVDVFFKVATAMLAITLVSFWWPFGCPLW
jgi:hypothetical protein